MKDYNLEMTQEKFEHLKNWPNLKYHEVNDGTTFSSEFWYYPISPLLMQRAKTPLSESWSGHNEKENNNVTTRHILTLTLPCSLQLLLHTESCKRNTVKFI